jgi:hypothetical protein
MFFRRDRSGGGGSSSKAVSPPTSPSRPTRPGSSRHNGRASRDANAASPPPSLQKDARNRNHPLLEPDAVFRREWGESTSLFSCLALFAQVAPPGSLQGEEAHQVVQYVELVGTIPPATARTRKDTVDAMITFIQSCHSLWATKASVFVECMPAAHAAAHMSAPVLCRCDSHSP